ncbi:MAG: T9SS type A sorting domain-containing protein [Saprospiraceae bacterium]|nr:T9SS type A sorting domain-containing protein [Saprospiraceae bacterium]
MKLQKSIYLTTFFSIISLYVLSGQQILDSKCGYDFMMETYEQQHPGFKTAVSNTFEKIKKSEESPFLRNEILTVDVVFHIVWKENAENLHDSVIFNQLDILNKDYRLLNDNRDEIRELFKDLQADAGIEFKLKGIVRVKTNANFALSLTGLPDNVKNGSNGGSNAISPDKTLNIWICHIRPIPFIGGQILGYAYPPAGLDNWPAGSNAPSAGLDGVVLDFRVTGSNNPNQLTVQGMNYTSLGRTCVHEVGHYLGLRHIWGDGGGIFGGSSCNADDGMADTPNQGSETGFGCDKNNNTCIDAQNDLPDMIENYMDYSDERCQNIFTKDQVSHMRKVLFNQRQGLIEGQVSAYDVAENTSFRVFPNPVTDQAVLHFEENKTGTIQIYDILGKVVFIQKSWIFNSLSYLLTS